MKQINCAILGASGYTGAELVRLLEGHPTFVIKALTANRHAGKPMEEIFPHVSLANLPEMVRIEDVQWNNIQLVFCALPHATTQEVIKDLPEHLKIVDLSADFRIRDAAVYEEWYGKPHGAQHLQDFAVYGLVEHYREEIKKTNLVASPGCYPTSALLPLIPLLEEKLIDPSSIIIDAKTGVTGAGRSPKESSLFAEISEGMKAYGIGHHRHMAEIEQELSLAMGEDVTISFTPHLVPMNRGILSTIYVSTDHFVGDIRDALKKRYQSDTFVHVLDEGQVPETRYVRGVNHCVMSVFPDRHASRVIIVSVIDNLVKGASGQAIQAANLMFDLSEDDGLKGLPFFP